MEEKQSGMEEKGLEKRSCEHGGMTYTHGSELCTLDRCTICRDGEWIEKKLYGPYAPVP